MKIITLDTDYLSKQYHYLNIRQLWNNEVDPSFYISEKLFNQNIKDNYDVSLKDSFLCYVNSELVGFIVIKKWIDKAWSFDNVEHKRWISLFYVSKEFRNNKIGSILLRAVESNMIGEQVKTLELGKDTYNFFPGLPTCFHESKDFFINKGFKPSGKSYDMMRHNLTVNDTIELPTVEYPIRFSTQADFPAMKVFFDEKFPGRWAYEFNQYINNGGDGRAFLIILDGEKVIGFCRINHQNSTEHLNNINWLPRFDTLYGIGPLGVDPDYQGKKLGYTITGQAINEAIKSGATDINIDWTSKTDFYKKFGFDIYETFISLHKPLEE